MVAVDESTNLRFAGTLAVYPLPVVSILTNFLLGLPELIAVAAAVFTWNPEAAEKVKVGVTRFSVKGKGNKPLVVVSVKPIAKAEPVAPPSLANLSKYLWQAANSPWSVFPERRNGKATEPTSS
jgi:hypothetical protein